LEEIVERKKEKVDRIEGKEKGPSGGHSFKEKDGK